MKKLNILLPLAFFMILSACTTSDENVATNVKPKVEPLIDNVANSTIKNNPIESNQSSQIEPEIKLELNTTKKKELANQQQHRKVKIKIDTTIPSKLLANESEDEGKSSNPSRTSIAAHPQQKQYQTDRPAPFRKR